MATTEQVTSGGVPWEELHSLNSRSPSLSAFTRLQKSLQINSLHSRVPRVEVLNIGANACIGAVQISNLHASRRVDNVRNQTNKTNVGLQISGRAGSLQVQSKLVAVLTSVDCARSINAEIRIAKLNLIIFCVYIEKWGWIHVLTTSSENSVQSSCQCDKGIFQYLQVLKASYYFY